MGSSIAWQWLVVGAILASAAPTVAEAHPLHTSMAHIEVTTGGVVAIRLRTFADDWSAAVARATGVKVGTDYFVPDEAVSRYVASKLQLRVAGRVVPLTLVRQQRDADVTWLEFTTPGVASLEGAVLENRLLMEFHADQVNVVKARLGKRELTLLFSQSSKPRRLA